ncbi:hypothetical protein Tco_0162788 [Tanacetum coccineum]
MEHTNNKKVTPAGLGHEMFVYRRNEQAKWRIKGSWVLSGKAHTGLQKRSRMALIKKIMVKLPQTTKSQGLMNHSEWPSPSRYGKPRPTKSKGLLNHSEGPSPHRILENHRQLVTGTNKPFQRASPPDMKNPQDN